MILGGPVRIMKGLGRTDHNSTQLKNWKTVITGHLRSSSQIYKRYIHRTVYFVSNLYYVANCGEVIKPSVIKCYTSHFKFYEFSKICTLFGRVIGECLLWNDPITEYDKTSTIKTDPWDTTARAMSDMDRWLICNTNSDTYKWSETRSSDNLNHGIISDIFHHREKVHARERTSENI